MFQTDLISSALFDEQRWSMLNGDVLVKLYGDTIATLIDHQVPVRTVTRHHWLSNAWYEEERRSAECSMRSLERAARRTGPLSDNAARCNSMSHQAAVILRPSMSEMIKTTG